MKFEDDDVGRLEAKLDTLVRLFAMSIISGVSGLKERAVRLSRAGLTPKEIALLCDSTPNAVSVALSAAKREAKGVGGASGR